VAAAQGNTGAASSIGDALNTDSSFLTKLDPIIARPFQVGYVDSTHLVYIIGGIIMALAFVLVLVMKELPLRTKSALDERLEEQRNEDAAALAREGAFDQVDAEDATNSLSADYEKELEPVSTGAHALVGNGGAHASNGNGGLHAPDSNGQSGNGHAGNGASGNGHSSNGRAASNRDVALNGEVLPAEPRRTGRHRAEV
jgi:hypothetical protein